MENRPSSFNWLRSDHLLFFTIATCRGKIVKFGWKFLQPQAAHVPHLESSGWTQIHPEVKFRPMWLALSPRVGLRLWVGENEKWLQLKRITALQIQRAPSLPYLLVEETATGYLFLTVLLPDVFSNIWFQPVL